MTMPRSYERFEKTCACLCPQSGTVHVKAMAILGSCSIPGSLDEFACAVGVDDEPVDEDVVAPCSFAVVVACDELPEFWLEAL